MDAYRRIVEHIQTIVNSQANIELSALREVAGEYDAAVREVNDRLQVCADLMRKGLRGEAVQLAQREPPLLEAAQLLDFDGLNDWRGLVDANDILPPPLVRVEIAADLNDALALEIPLASLLDTHRLLALSRSPMADRLFVLRQIRAIDEGNPLWVKDQQLYEQRYLKELRETLTKPENLTSEQVLSLAEELGDSRWIEKPPSDLRETCERLQRATRNRLARSELAEIASALEAKVKAEDFEGATAQEARWKDALSRGDVMPDSPLALQAGPWLDWVVSKRRRIAADSEHRSVLLELEAAIQGDISPERLELLLQQAIARVGAVPESLANRVESVILQRKTEQRKKKLLQWGSLAATCLVCVVALFLGAREWLERKAVAAFAKEVEGALVARDFGKAKQLLEEIKRTHPTRSSRKVIADLAKEALSRTEEEQRRAGAFADTLRHLETIDPIELSSGSISELEKSAISAEEKVSVETLKAKMATAARQRQEKQTSDWQKKSHEIDTALASINVRDMSAWGAVSELRKQSDLLGGGPNEDCQAALRARSDVINKLERSIKLHKTHQEAASKLDLAVGDARRFQELLRELSKLLESEAESIDMQAVASEFESVTSAINYSIFAESAEKVSLKALSPDMARGWLAILEPYAASKQSSPWKNEASARIPFLKAVAWRRDADPKSPPKTSGLVGFLGRRQFHDVYRVKTRKGLVYNVAEPLVFSAEVPSIRAECFVDASLARRKITFTADNVLENEIAPHVPVAKSFLEKLEALPPENWESTFLGMIEQLSNESSYIDPVLRLILIKNIADVGSQGSHAIAEGCLEGLRIIRMNEEILRANWLDPEDKEGIIARDRAAEILAKLSIDKIKKTAGSTFKEDTRPWAKSPRWIGWAHRDGLETAIRLTKKDALNGSLVVLSSTPSGAIDWAEVGRVTDGKVTSHGKAAGLRYGTPVFVRIE